MYTCIGVNQDGDYIEHVTDKTREDMARELEIKGYYLIKYRKNKNKRNKRLGDKELYLFSKNLGLILSSNVDLLSAIDIMKTANNKYNRFKKILLEVENRVLRGESLYFSLEKLGFSNFFLNSIKVGEISGNLDKSFLALGEFYKERYEFKNKLTKLLIYPLVLLAITIFSIFILSKLVIPKFISMYLEYDYPLPRLTVYIFKISKFIERYYSIILGIFIVALVIYRKIRSRNRIKYLESKLMYKLPFIKQLIVLKGSINFLHSLKILSKSDIQFYKALEFLYLNEDNLYFKHKLEGILISMEKGNTFYTSIEKTLIFPESFGVFMKVGEKTGKINEALGNAHEYYKEELWSLLNKLSSLIEPVLLIVISIIIGSIVVAVVLPMFNMAEFII